MKFKANQLDLDLDLETLSGEKFHIDGPKSITAEAAATALGKIAKEQVSSDLHKWSGGKIAKEDEELEGKTAEVIIGIIAKSLIGIYGKDDIFWLNNFDPATLIQIRKEFVGVLSGVKKKE